jgi:CelD/BcsL family acetyltransferase involved in cellulose biosynthesis
VPDLLQPSAAPVAAGSVADFDSLDAARDAWEQAARGQDNVFATWEWADAWWRVYGGRAEPAVRAVRDPAAGMAAVVPLQVTRRGPLRLARFIGHGPADQLGPVCAPEHRPAAAAALRSLVSDRVGARGLLLAERVRGDEGWEALLGARAVSRRSFPLLRIDGLRFDEWLATKSANFRQQAGRRERKLVRDRGLRFRLVTGGRELGAATDTLMRLHGARWGNASSVLDPDRRRFYDAFLAAAADRGWVRLWLADFGERPVAAWLGFRYGGVEAYYQSGRDPAEERGGVGTALLVHTIREAFGDGLREYRFLLGDEAYKDKFASDDPGVDLMTYGRGPLPALAAAAGRARERAKQRGDRE